MINAVIVDDEDSAIDTLQKLLSRYCPEVIIVGKANDVRSAYDLIIKQNPDLIFLDIYMPGDSGLKLMEKIPDRQVVFTTAYEEHAIKAIKLSAFDYLLKPIDPEELRNTITRFKTKWHQTTSIGVEILSELLNDKKPRRLIIPTLEGLHIMELDDLIYCEASKSYTIFYLENKDHIVSAKPIGEYERLLESLIRIHRSHLINPRHVQLYKKGRGGQVTMSNGKVLEVSKSSREVLLKRLNLH